MGRICLANVAIESAATRSHAQIAAHTRYSVPPIDEKYYLSMRPNGFGFIYLGSPVDRELAGWVGGHCLEYAVDDSRLTVRMLAQFHRLRFQAAEG